MSVAATRPYRISLTSCINVSRLAAGIDAPRLDHIVVIKRPATVAGDFLEHLERDCVNTARTRNLRLTAVRAFMKYVEYEVPTALDQVRRVLAISKKRTEERLVNHLTKEEMKSILDAPDPSTRSGIRDQAMLYLGFAAGLRVSELVGLGLDDIEFDGPYPSILVRGKGRQQRRLPLWQEAARALRA
jgi:site-specific recombinase XerD